MFVSATQSVSFCTLMFAWLYTFWSCFIMIKPKPCICWLNSKAPALYLWEGFHLSLLLWNCAHHLRIVNFNCCWAHSLVLVFLVLNHKQTIFLQRFDNVNFHIYNITNGVNLVLAFRVSLPWQIFATLQLSMVGNLLLTCWFLGLSQFHLFFLVPCLLYSSDSIRCPRLPGLLYES